MDSFAPADGSQFAAVPPVFDQSQVFDYGADAHLQFGGGYYDGDNDLMGGMEDSNDPKRRRIARVRALRPRVLGIFWS